MEIEQSLNEVSSLEDLCKEHLTSLVLHKSFDRALIRSILDTLEAAESYRNTLLNSRDASLK